MNDFLNKQIVDAVKKHINPNDNLVDVLMNTLALGKESAYRRICGKIPFTFSEIAQLASVFHFSLDSILGISFTNVAVINTCFFNTNQMYADYKQMLEDYISLFKEMKRSSGSKFSTVNNTIPFALYAGFEGLSKFKLYRWMHQMDISFSTSSFSEMKIPDDVWVLHQEFIREMDSLDEICYVLDRNIFSTFVNDINHFIQLGYMTSEDRLLMKNELFALLDIFEQTVRRAGANPRNNVSVYISNIDFDSSYSYFEAEDVAVSGMRVFVVNAFTTKDVHFYKTQKKWIESLKRYAVLISGCGEMERVKFIAKQREIITLL